jgi:hypothetical protein
MKKKIRIAARFSRHSNSTITEKKKNYNLLLITETLEKTEEKKHKRKCLCFREFFFNPHFAPMIGITLSP